MKPAVVAAWFVVATAVAGCGAQTSTATPPAPSTSAASVEEAPSPSPSPSASPVVHDGPACGDVWKAGEHLPRGYAGCLRGDTWVRQDARHCEFGRDLTIYADTFYAVTGGTIIRAGRPLLEQRIYRRVLRLCSG